MTTEEHFEKSLNEREKFWSELGDVNSDVISHVINPAFLGGPQWPGLRQSFLMIKTESGTIFASDGLSDPYSDRDNNPDHFEYNGLGLELFVECNEKWNNIDEAKNSWQFSLLYKASQICANNPNVLYSIKDHTYISTDAFNVPFPDEMNEEKEKIGLLLGLPSEYVPNRLKLSLEEILFVNVKLLTIEESKYVDEHDGKGRKEVAKRLIKQGNTSLSNISRKSVI
ncbi:suppressor of fused domain protein [uncultured Aquimarina sp.]|uniref:suppressor of fused domain protein n=1 Tax=uncultured Aquimarina sp. TaxID=575652 RepID=UPI0026328D25|nr:suppressor of fused domain protein [uncultured Aquimarina sp.]